VEELLFGGEAGGGTSALLRAVGVTLCTIWPGAVIPLFRRTYPELEETHIRRIQAEVPRTLATYHNDRHELRRGSSRAATRLHQPGEYGSQELRERVQRDRRRAGDGHG
jgi:hypothetical protein